jgi:hypothetical protein
MMTIFVIYGLFSQPNTLSGNGNILMQSGKTGEQGIDRANRVNSAYYFYFLHERKWHNNN